MYLGVFSLVLCAQVFYILDAMKELQRRDYEHFYKIFKIFIDTTKPISLLSWEMMRARSRVVKYNRGEVLLEAGQSEHVFRFLVDGMVKCIDGSTKEAFVYDFRVGPIILAEPFSLFHDTPSRMSFVTISNCYIIEIPKVFFLDNERRYIDVLLFGYTCVTNYLGLVYHKQALLHRLTAEERYKQFLAEYPDVAPYAKIEDIASYINVTPPSLSRIRKQMKWDDTELHLKKLSNELELILNR